ncbi:hypothetical protein RND81_09G255600 [Saponaria officinalis]|uniref:RING-type E3 ubiquitin transferase n=1 Tax=Saponaria officinalis TaxID=3572 RepID=A0AAW1IS13_SAPOF
MEEEKGIVIPCKHLPKKRRTTKRVILVRLWYKEFERMIDCESESSSSTPYIRNGSSVLAKRYQQVSCNPVDCQECKSDIIDYFTSIIAHPNPDGVLADLCTQLNDYIHQGIPSPLVGRSWLATAAIYKVRTYYMKDIILDENPLIELVSYHISNYTERHYLPQRQGSDSRREWCVTWLGARNPRPTHPRLCDLNLDKVDGQSLDAMDFTCPICLKDEVNKFVDAQVDVEDDIVVALPCRHIYHKSCISLWLERANCCPLCRFQLPNVCVAWGTHQTSSLGNMNLVSHFVSQPEVNVLNHNSYLSSA